MQKIAGDNVFTKFATLLAAFQQSFIVAINNLVTKRYAADLPKNISCPDPSPVGS